MKLIFGLGNPDRKYIYTLHNVGFLTVDYFLEEYKARTDKKKHSSFYAKVRIFDESCVFAKPITYMNRSGLAVAPFLRSLKLSLDDLIVIYDDVDIEAGKVRIKKGGGDGGHKGLRSIIDEVGGESDFLRIRVGIGRPPENLDVSDYVLKKVSKKKLQSLVERSREALSVLLEHGYQKACNIFNG